jgi:hypothetical protein
MDAGHPARVWPLAQFDEKAVLCGACGTELTILQYLNCQAVCPACRAGFNARCALHYHLYFETSADRWLNGRHASSYLNGRECDGRRAEKARREISRDS